jgi:glutamate synthase domain-containing protein 2
VEGWEGDGMSGHRHQARRVFVALSILVPATLVYFHFYRIGVWIAAPLIILGYVDLFQKKQTIRRNFPVIGNFRYLFELVRPEINQYFVESNIDGKPFSRERRSLIYQRSKGVTDTVPFGTQQDVYAANYEWVNHSLAPKPTLHTEPRVRIGGKDCKQPYDASLFNISAMSYGSLSRTAVTALNRGAKIGGFYHNTGEGGLSPYHLEPGGDIVWQIGTGYFSSRGRDGQFSDEEFKKRAVLPQVKMIEIKLSQGAKPGHGGILPKSKVTKEISDIRGVPMGEDVLSPPAHTAFDSPEGLLRFVKRLRELSGGKPVGFKLCVGKKREFFAIVKAMLSTGIKPDFITIDGGEGGTGAAPLEFSNSVGTPLSEGLVFVHNALVGAGVREEIRLIASGHITTGFALLTKMALGADLCNSARGMLFSLGCIQALRCNNNTCPTGIATQDPALYKGLDVGDKSVRVAHFQKATVHAFLEVLGAAGLAHPREVRPWHIQRRISTSEVRHYGELFEFVSKGDLLADTRPDFYARAWVQATPESWDALVTGE